MWKYLFYLLCLLGPAFAGKISTPTEMIRENGYFAEEHRVTTSDGYILTLHRIPTSPKSSCSSGSNEIGPDLNCVRPVVFVQHGLVSSSADFLISGPSKGLAYLLADAGYDVWLGNFRGNTYSRRHVHMNPDRRDFWKFSWHELGIYDLPAMIDYVLEHTNQRKLHYIGHSQGTTTFLVMTSTIPSYNDKIISAHLMAPIAFMSNMKSPLIRALSRVEVIDFMAKFVGDGEFMPSTKFLELSGSLLCNDRAFTQELCMNSMFLLAGYDSDGMNRTLLPEIMKRYPAGSSIFQLLHYTQEMRSGRFCQFDYGTVGNLKKYSTLKPPNYNLRDVVAPVSFYYGGNDWLADIRDVKQLIDKLQNVEQDFPVTDPKWNHIDFLWGINAKDYVYQPIIQTMNRYSKTN